MALSIKTAEADRLARELSQLTGRTMTAVVTEALSEKLARERAGAPASPIDWAAVDHLLARMRGGSTLQPIAKAEWDAICDEGIDERIEADRP